MAKSSTVISLRLTNETLQKIEEALRSKNMTTRMALETRNEWIVRAIKEKLAHLKRSRGRCKCGHVEKLLSEGVECASVQGELPVRPV